MEQNKLRPVQYAGMMTFMNQNGVDVGPLEARSGMPGFIQQVDVVKGRYYCHYAVSEDGLRIDALMLVSDQYPGEVLETPEKIGSVTVSLSGVVGFFSSPKKEYSMKQLGTYICDLEREHSGRCWVNLNSKQFMSPSSQGVGTSVPVFVHRNADGKVDAFQMEFNRKETDLLIEGMEKVNEK